MNKTFEEIAPLWAQKLRDRGIRGAKEICNINGQELDIRNYELCIVGEAYHFNFSDKYANCGRCLTFATKFEEKIWTWDAEDKDLEPVKQAFVEHWNQEHSTTK